MAAKVIELMIKKSLSAMLIRRENERFALKIFYYPCNLCGSQENLQRQAMKVMLKSWDKQFPGRLETIFTSLQNVALHSCR